MDQLIYPDAQQIQERLASLQARAESAEAEATQLRELLAEANRVGATLLDLWMAAQQAKGPTLEG